MGYVYLVLSKLAAILKMMSVKKCGNIASGAKNSVKINLLRSLGCLAVALIVCIFSGFKAMNTPGIYFTVLSGVSNGILLWSWILAAASAPMVTVEVFCMIGGVVIPLVISPLVLDVPNVTLIQWIGSLLLFGAMFCLSKKGKGGKITPKSILLMCIAGLSNAGGIISQKFYNDFNGEKCGTVADFQLGTYIFTIAVLAAIFFIMQIFIKEEKTENQSKITGRVVIFICIAFAMTYASQFLATVAAGKISASVFYPLQYVISMPMIFLVDVIFFKEKVTVNNIIGVLLVTASGVLINL